QKPSQSRKRGLGIFQGCESGELNRVVVAFAFGGVGGPTGARGTVGVGQNPARGHTPDPSLQVRDLSRKSAGARLGNPRIREFSLARMPWPCQNLPCSIEDQPRGRVPPIPMTGRESLLPGVPPYPAALGVCRGVQ